MSPPKLSTQGLAVNSSSNGVLHPIKMVYPPVLWVIGGPGSNKAALCTMASNETGWHHVSIGNLLRIAADTPNRTQNLEVSDVYNIVGFHIV